MRSSSPVSPISPAPSSAAPPLTPGTARTPRSARPPLVAAAALTAMAALAPIATFVLLPDGRTSVAGWLMLVVAALDVVVALALVPVLEPAGRRLARVTAALRIGYGLVLGYAAAGLVVAGDAERFDQIWDLALGVFGLSLVGVGVLLWRLAGAPRWLAALVVVAGAGYVVDAVVSQVGPAGAFEVSTISFVGEVALIVWLVLNGLRARRALA
ncbi:DUF4386 family protein [Georgenia sp. Z1344]|uniref:DUF4386 family protein n=1 Tax=Georgenia sp. Z1344 TaxID=3416706 RepID=UPI003CF534D6